MICLRCGHCCKSYLVAVVDDPKKGIAADNFIVNKDLEQLDFVVFNPNLVKEKQLFIFPIKREDILEDIELAEKRITEFREIWESFILKLI